MELYYYPIGREVKFGGLKANQYPWRHPLQQSTWRDRKPFFFGSASRVDFENNMFNAV